MKNVKTLGPGGLSLKLIKYCRYNLRERINNLIDRVIRCKISKEKKISHISSI
jgi:hypothetical protein